MSKDEARKLAEAYQAKTGCRWAEACLEIKRRYPEARAAFGAPPKAEAAK